jgi:cobalt-precorrin-5B (C1)-methyltransferase
MCASIKALLTNHHRVDILLPSSDVASIDTTLADGYAYSIKAPNDDIDVTIGAKIEARIKHKNNTQLSTIEHHPSIIEIDNSKIYLYAGEGLGVVTKNGLKIAPNYPAINPTPLRMLKENLKGVLKDKEYHIVVSIEDGKEIAKNTANQKVGVLGGISILGTTGIVKPISSSAYIDSIKAEISVVANYHNRVIFTLGNSAYEYAKSLYNSDSIVEIGNFIYDSIQILKSHASIKEILFITSIAKMTKVAQGFKNTHNRYGDIDFDSLKRLIKDNLDIHLSDEYATVKAIENSFDNDTKHRFQSLINSLAQSQMQEYAKEIGIDIEISTHIVEAKRGV